MQGITIFDNVLLGPLAKNDGCCDVLVGVSIVSYCCNLPFRNFLLAYFLKNASWRTGPER